MSTALASVRLLDAVAGRRSNIAFFNLFCVFHPGKKKKKTQSGATSKSKPSFYLVLEPSSAPVCAAAGLHAALLTSRVQRPSKSIYRHRQTSELMCSLDTSFIYIHSSIHAAVIR